MAVRYYKQPDLSGTPAGDHFTRYVCDLASEIPATANYGDVCWCAESASWHTWSDDQWVVSGGGEQGPPGPASIMVVPIVAQPSAAVTWTNMPAAETFLLGSHRHATRVDLTNFTQVRLVVNKQATAGAANSIIFVKYRATFDATVGNWSAIGTSAVSVAVNVQNTVLASAWVDLAAGARADVLVCLAGASGDGVLDPQFGTISLQFR